MEKQKIEDRIKILKVDLEKETNRKHVDPEFIKTLENRIRELELELNCNIKKN